MGTFNIHEAKSQLSRLIERVRAGEEVIIAKAGKPVARLVLPIAAGAARKPGSLRGRIRIGPDFNTPLSEEEMAAFEGSAARR